MSSVAGDPKTRAGADGFRRVVLNRVKSWKVWQLDGELRYGPVVDALPLSGLPICEVGSGPAGLRSGHRGP